MAPQEGPRPEPGANLQEGAHPNLPNVGHPLAEGILPQSMNRRRFFRLLGGAGASLAGVGIRPRGAFAEENPQSDEEAGPTPTPYLESFNGLDFDTMRANVEDNIESFMMSSAEDLMAVGESAKMHFPMEPVGSVPAPVFNFEGAENAGPSYFLTKSGETDKYFPNLSLHSYPNEFDKDGQRTRIVNLQGIYLGRTAHKMDSSIGEIDGHVLYLGMYDGDPETGEDLNRFVLPVWVGWTTDQDATSWNPVYRIGPEDGDPAVENVIDGNFSVMSQYLQDIDKYIGNAVFGVQVGAPNPADPGLVAQAEAYGFPSDFFTVDSVTRMHEVTRETYDNLATLTLSRAQKDGYSLSTFQGTETPVQAPITDAHLGSKTVEDALGSLPQANTWLESPKITIEQAVELPRAGVTKIFPTSHLALNPQLF